MKEKLPITIKEKVVAVSSFNKKISILYIIAAIMIFVDGFITTPIAISFANAYEANIWHQHWYNVFGISYFFIITPIAILMLYIFTRGLDVIIYQYSKNNEKLQRKNKDLRWITAVWLILIALLFFSAVIRNVEVIINGIR